MKKILYILGALLFSFDAFADGEVFATSGINFGKFVQLGKSSTVIMSKYGERSLGDGSIAALSPNTHSATVKTFDTITYNKGDIPGEIKFDQINAQTYPFCFAKISKIEFSTTTINTNENTTISVGAQLDISGYCKEGIYNGDLDITYQLTIDGNSTNKLVRIPFEFEVEEPLSVTKSVDAGDMDFGMYITPSQDATITLSAGGVDAVNISSVGGKTPHCANMVVSGVSSRMVQMTFDSSSMWLFLNGNEDATSKLEVNQFNVNGVALNGSDNKSHTFQLPATNTAQATQALAVGATLHVTPNTAAGTYTGSINVTFIYNDY